MTLKTKLYDGFGSLSVIVVEDEEVITCPITGECGAVTDNNSIAILNKIYVTENTYTKLKEDN